jgi:hypothetical protein
MQSQLLLQLDLLICQHQIITDWNDQFEISNFNQNLQKWISKQIIRESGEEHS